MDIKSKKKRLVKFGAALSSAIAFSANAAGIPTVSGAGNTTDWVDKGNEWLVAGVGLAVTAVLSYFFLVVCMNTVKVYQDTGPDGKSTMVDVGKQALIGVVLGTAIIFILNAVTAIF